MTVCCLYGVAKTVSKKKHWFTFIQDARTDAFYEKITFKTMIICDLTNPLIKREVLWGWEEKEGRD